MIRRNLAGQRFGRLTAIRPTDKRENATGSVIWECRCDCGNMTFVSSTALTSGNTTSCGCYKKEEGSKNLRKNREKSYIEGTSINAITNKVRKDNKSGTKGIHWDKKHKSWAVRIGFKGKRYYLGNFKNLEDAIKARQEAEEKLYRPFIEKHKRDL